MHKLSLELGFIDGQDNAVEQMPVIAMIEDMNTVCPDESLPLHERIALVYDFYKAGQGVPIAWTYHIQLCCVSSCMLHQGDRP